MRLGVKYTIIFAVCLLPALGPCVAFEPHLWPITQQYCGVHCEEYIALAVVTIYIAVVCAAATLVTYLHNIRRGWVAAGLSLAWLPFWIWDIVMYTACRGKFIPIMDTLEDMRETWAPPMSPRSIQKYYSEEEIDMYFPNHGRRVPA